MFRHVVRHIAVSLLLVAMGLPINASGESIKMVITAAVVSDKGLAVYESLAQYLSSRLDQEVRVISGTSYSESNLLLEKGYIQVGFVCGMPYVQQEAEGKVRLLAIPVMADQAGQIPGTPGYSKVPGKYYSYTIVHRDADLHSWADIKGKRYVYNDQRSNSGYNMPRYKLVQLGAHSWEEWFSQIMVSGSHEESIRMVALGLADASSVDSLVLDYDLHIGDEYAKQIKVIETLFPGGAGAPPIIVGSQVSVELEQKLQTLLINMHNDPTGREILNQALLKRFAPADDSNYDDIRKMMRAAKKAGFVDHKAVQHKADNL